MTKRSRTQRIKIKTMNETTLCSTTQRIKLVVVSSRRRLRILEDYRCCRPFNSTSRNPCHHLRSNNPNNTLPHHHNNNT